MSKIKDIRALEILDSRGNPTVACMVKLSSGIKASAQVPSGASTGKHEAKELRDGGKRYGGLGVSQAVSNINKQINKSLSGKSYKDPIELDYKLCVLDGSKNKSKLGANTILAVSLAYARVQAYESKLPLFKYLKKVYQFPGIKLPKPTMNILNGGRHADNGIDVQEFMIVPQSSNFSKNLQIGAEVYHTLKKILNKDGLATGLGDEGGFAPKLKNNTQALDYLLKAIKRAGYRPGTDVKLAMDVAASEFYKQGKYKFEKKSYNSSGMIDIYKKWVKKYPIVSIEDGLSQDDWSGWQGMTKDLKKVMIVGDDLFCTNYKRLEKGVGMRVANALLVKPNQIGTLSETMAAIKLAQKHKYKIIISHRSGETCDDFIADLAVASGADYIKSGAPARSERLAKYNRLLKIEKFYL